MAHRTIIPESIAEEIRSGKVDYFAIPRWFSYLMVLMSLYFGLTGIVSVAVGSLAIGYAAFGPMFALIIGAAYLLKGSKDE